MKHAQFSFTALALVASFFMVACGAKSTTTGGSTAMKTGDKPVPVAGQPSKAQIKILNAEALTKILAVDGLAELYAVQGQLLDRVKIDEMVLKSQNVVACMTQTSNFEFTNSDVSIPVVATPSLLPKDPQVHVVTISPASATAPIQINQQQQQQQPAPSQYMLNSFQIVCMKAGGTAMTPSEIAGALQGIILIQ